MKFFLVGLIFIFTSSVGQQHVLLNIGDKIPEDSFRIKNYDKPYARINDFKGKYVILDLWGIYCSGCIEKMPYMERLQSHFKQKLQIIMVTKFNQKDVEKLAFHSENVRNNKLPSVMGDAFSSLFDYRYVPTYIWIDKNGVIKYVTHGNAITDKNITAFVSGDEIKLNYQKDIKLGDGPALVEWYPYTKEFGIASYFAPSPKEYNGGGGFQRLTSNSGNVYKISCRAFSLKKLYKEAYFNSDAKNISDDRIIFRTKDSSKFTIYDYGTSENIFNYELFVHNNSTTEQFYKFMQYEIDFYLGFKSHFVKFELPCYVIKTQLGKQSLLSTRHNQQKPSVDADAEDGSYKAVNVPWGAVFNNITSQKFASHTVIDETGLNQDSNVDFIINRRHWSDIGLLNKELYNYGLYVTIENRSLDCIIIEDLDN